MTDLIHEGDDVLLFLDRRRSYLVKVEKGKDFHTHKGFVPIGNLIGKKYSTRIKSNMNVEFVAFKPTIRDYVFKIARKTQIVYPKDISLIIFLGNVQSGSHIVEAGTGTGALTLALAYYVRPSGRIYSYEIREDFIQSAKRNLRKSGVIDYVEIKNRDITQGIEEKNLDVIVLDIAVPWLVVPHAYPALKGSGMFVSFSPTIDQVVKTKEALIECGFADICTYETLLRSMQIIKGKTRPDTLMTGHTGYLTFARKAEGSIMEPLENKGLNKKPSTQEV